MRVRARTACTHLHAVAALLLVGVVDHLQTPVAGLDLGVCARRRTPASGHDCETAIGVQCAVRAVRPRSAAHVTAALCPRRACRIPPQPEDVVIVNCVRGAVAARLGGAARPAGSALRDRTRMARGAHDRRARCRRAQKVRRVDSLLGASCWCHRVERGRGRAEGATAPSLFPPSHTRHGHACHGKRFTGISCAAQAARGAGVVAKGAVADAP